MSTITSPTGPATSSKSWLNLLKIIGATALLSSVTQGQNLEPGTGTAPAPRPINPGLVQVEDIPGLPRVLLIGDSITMGYTIPVREKLKGIANVHHPVENCGPTERGLANLDKWLGSGHWDVIQFNFGLHDLKYLNDKKEYVSPDNGKQLAPPAVYGKQLREIAIRLKKTGAKIIFATTTPVPLGTLGRVAGDEKIYNEVAVTVMKDLDIPIDDLCAYVTAQQLKLPLRPESEKPTPPKHPELRPGEIQLPFNVHFTPEGYEQLANLVVASVKKQLSAPAAHSN